MEFDAREEMLTRIDERTKRIATDLEELKKHADNGGWSRCMLHDRRLEDIERRLKTRTESQTWFNRLVAGSIILMVLQKIWLAMGG